MEIYNIYCDESCHLEHDHQPIMGVGAIWCPESERDRLSLEIAAIKNKYKATGELKWTKVSKSKEAFYLELVNWFFKEKSLHFRALIVLNKSKLNHSYFNHDSHDTFYYKMYFSLLNKLLSPENKYNIYLDIKDTQSRLKNKKLREILCNNAFDFTQDMVSKVQNIRSEESYLLQLTDLFLGALTYKHRYLLTNSTKLEVIKLIESKVRFPLTRSTPLREEKFNLFLFSPKDAGISQKD